MTVIVLILLALGAFLYAWLAHRKTGPDTQMAVVAAVEEFASQMEAENDRMVEMIAALRHKLDGYEVQKEREIYTLKNELTKLQTQVAEMIEPKTDETAIVSNPPKDELPEFLQPKYKEVAERLLRGDDAHAIMMELNVGYGEVDLVKGLLQSRRMHS
ncbi:hypothetical protein [Sulfoacidibacillus thermotolerans]|uniref:DUF2802 domain-containing protein n=1 Tax=Sulfoacidibacillus thermotolerans TaxID=1765684 RepID=A0A2U3DA93_SULT2|nr:hypothetical protein [Sulfoacidibacillus thermotolerans]PWI58208.1 hypothetical protein BM613_04555 [Sulfoacidibacillus thermotolerans]